jgi:site-specific recombinase XerD
MPKRTGDFPVWISRYVRDHLAHERNMSSRTIQSYAQSWKLMLRFLAELYGKNPETLSVQDFTAPLVLEFLDWVEAGGATHRVRPCSPRTRNLRLAAIKGFFTYVAVHDLAVSAIASSIGGIRGKRFDRAVIDYLTEAEINALTNSIDGSTELGIRNRAMIVVCLAGGLRVSELLALTMEDIRFDMEPYYRVHGKGRRQRDVLMSPETVRVLNAWLDIRERVRGGYVFEGREKGRPLSRDAFAYNLRNYIKRAERNCPSLIGKNLTPHGLRHSYGMRVLRRTRDRRAVMLALGHESAASTEAYLQILLSRRKFSRNSENLASRSEIFLNAKTESRHC